VTDARLPRLLPGGERRSASGGGRAQEECEQRPPGGLGDTGRHLVGRAPDILLLDLDAGEHALDVADELVRLLASEAGSLRDPLDHGLAVAADRRLDRDRARVVLDQTEAGAGRGVARVPDRHPDGEDALPFQVWDGEALVDIGDYLSRHPRPDLLDFERRMHELAAGPYGHRAGDVLLFARSGDTRPIEERFYFSGRYRSWHGSPDAQDSRIPLVVAHGRERGAALRARVTAAVGDAPMQEDIPALILSLLGR